MAYVYVRDAGEPDSGDNSTRKVNMPTWWLAFIMPIATYLIGVAIALSSDESPDLAAQPATISDIT